MLASRPSQGGWSLRFHPTDRFEILRSNCFRRLLSIGSKSLKGVEG